MCDVDMLHGLCVIRYDVHMTQTHTHTHIYVCMTQIGGFFSNFCVVGSECGSVSGATEPRGEASTPLLILNSHS